MFCVTTECAPYADILGGPFVWQSESAQPWIDIAPVGPIRGKWVRLTWRWGLFQPVSRLVLRCQLNNQFPTGDLDVFLPGAPFGRGSAIVYLPAYTERLLLSPVNWKGEFRFDLEKIEILPLPAVFGIAAGRSPGGALHALGAALIGRKVDMRNILRDALGETPLSMYAAWLERGRRPYDREFDGKLTPAAPHIRLLINCESHTLEEILSEVNAFCATAKSGVCKSWSAILLCDEKIQSNPNLPDPFRFASANTDAAVLIQDLSAQDLVVAIPMGARLHPNALDIIASAAVAAPMTSLFFGDNDQIDAHGRVCDPIMRAAFDPLLLAYVDYIGSSAIWRVSAVRASHADRDQSHLPDPVNAESGLNLSRFIFRFPLNSDKPNARINHSGDLENSDRPTPSAAILIPTRDRLDLLKPCVESILDKTIGYFRVVILDNESCDPETFAYFESLRGDPRIDIYRIEGPFNFSRICNEGARLRDEAVLVFLNNDILIIDEDWLEKLTRMASRPDVGAVGAKLLFPNNRVQHAGVIAGLYGRAGHFELRMEDSDPGYFMRANSPHQLLCVTGACLAVERTKFATVRGFDEINLPIDLNDVDLCFRLYSHGWKTIMLGNCRLYHLESASRGHTTHSDILYAGEKRYFSSIWTSLLRADPHFSPNLSLYSTGVRLG